jgi:hypothetical protein
MSHRTKKHVKEESNKSHHRHITKRVHHHLPLMKTSIQPPNEGWKVLHVSGTPQERGFMHGFLLHEELAKMMERFPFIVNQELLFSYKKYVSICRRTISPIVKKDYPEFYQEIVAIVQGAQYGGVEIDVHTLIAWNALCSMYEYLHNHSAKRTKTGHCSAFLATGKATANGEIVMGHTTHTGLVSGHFFNIVLYVTPEKGIPFCMQTAAGCIASGTDWFITRAGIVGCETTISEINYRPDFGHGNAPYFCRIRHAMQYGETLDDYAKIMTTHNAGDYASSWLFGDVNSQEIMLCELGLKITNVQRTKDGIYYGMNSAISPELRSQETNDKEFFDAKTSSGGRNQRFQELLYKKYYGKLTTKIAQKILSDHYNVVTKTKKPGASTICVHTYDDAGYDASNYPHGCTDGKVLDAQMARNMQFIGRFGPCCGHGFDADHFLEHHPKYKKEWERALESYPVRKWTTLSCLTTVKK